MLKFLIARQMVNRQRKEYPVEYLEQKHVDLSLPYPNDSSFFYGGDPSGNAFIARMAFRGPDRIHEYWSVIIFHSISSPMPILRKNTGFRRRISSANRASSSGGRPWPGKSPMYGFTGVQKYSTFIGKK